MVIRRFSHFMPLILEVGGSLLVIGGLGVLVGPWLALIAAGTVLVGCGYLLEREEPGT